jgi:hypothetical protein
MFSPKTILAAFASLALAVAAAPSSAVEHAEVVNEPGVSPGVSPVAGSVRHIFYSRIFDLPNHLY